MTTSYKYLTCSFVFILCSFSFRIYAQSREFNFRQGPLSYWQQEFGSITQSAHWTMPDTRGEGIILRNVAGYASEINMVSHPLIQQGWIGDILVENWAPNQNWCGSLEVAVHGYSSGNEIKKDSYATYGGGFKTLEVDNVTCNDEKGCYIRVKMRQGYGSGNSNMNYLRGLTITNYYGNQNLTQDESGNVAIASSTNAAFKLQVGGEIRSVGVTVEATPWPDYVFQSDYKLKSLEEVKQYIDRNGHLPEMPPAASVEESGLDLGEMNRLLVQKLEEMTLYQIELMEQLKKQSHEIDQLKSNMDQ